MVVSPFVANSVASYDTTLSKHSVIVSPWKELRNDVWHDPNGTPIGLTLKTLGIPPWDLSPHAAIG